MIQLREGGLGLEWQLLSLMEGDPVVGNAWHNHQVWVVECAFRWARSVGQIRWSVAIQRAWAMKLWAFVWCADWWPTKDATS